MMGLTERFRMPAEWEPHEATWMVWPHNRADWENKTQAVEWCYVDIVRKLVGGERVVLVYRNDRIRQRAERRLTQSRIDLNQIDSYVIETDRSWIRDSGPLFVVRGSATKQHVAMTDWCFNGWGRYRSFRRDNALSRRIAKRLGMRRFEMKAQSGTGRKNMVLEGGSIDVNGRGLLLTTEECLLSNSQARNPFLSQTHIESVLCDGLGIHSVLWLGGGIAGDDAHGHIDYVARFVGTGTVVAAVERNHLDINHEQLIHNLRRLRKMRNTRGRQLEVVTLPMPRPIFFNGIRLPASYLNFYIGNNVVLVPTFNDPTDRDALLILAELFTTREVIGIHALDLILGLGAIHCITQQQPRGHILPA